MKTSLRRFTALFLTVLTVLSFSVFGLGAFASDTDTITFSTAFYAYNATSGAWEKADVLHPNQSVKLRVGVGTNFDCNSAQMVMAFDKSVLTPNIPNSGYAVLNTACATTANGLQSVFISSSSGLTARLAQLNNITAADANQYGFIAAILEPKSGQSRFVFDGSTWLFEVDMTVADAGGKSAQVQILPNTVSSKSNINGYSVFYKFTSDSEKEGSMVWYEGTPSVLAESAYVQTADETHTHTFTEKAYIDATCTADGISVFVCSCGAVQGYGTIAAGHKYGNFTFDGADAKPHTKVCANDETHTVTENCTFTSVVTKAPTCTEKGLRTYTCSVCNGTYTEEIAVLTHAYGNFTFDGADAKTHTKVCANDETHTVTENCTFTSAVTKAPTCTEKGLRTYTCSVCKGTYTEEIAALNHAYGDFAFDGADVKTHTKVCANDETHTVTENCTFTSAVTKAPTCLQKGVRTYTCSVCSGTYTEEIDMIPHSFSKEWSSDSENHWHACTADKNCTEKTDLAAHADNDGDGCCDVCGKSFGAPYSLCTLKIRNNKGSNTVDYRNGIQLTALVGPGELPENVKIVWYVDGTEAGTGTTFIKTDIRAAFKVKVQLEDNDGNVWHDRDGNEIKDEEQINVNAGFFKKIVAFFRWLFKLLKTIPQAIDY